jgi:hypothetical protein
MGVKEGARKPVIRQFRELHGRGFVPVSAGGFFAGLETPKLMRKKRRPLRRESRRFMWFLQSSIAHADQG